MSEFKLKSCQCCSGEARLMAQHFTDDSHIYWVECRKCGMQGPHMHDAGQAIVYWNSLAIPDLMKRIEKGSADA